MKNRASFLNDLKIQGPVKKPTQSFTSKIGALSRALIRNKIKLAIGLMAIATPLIISGCSGTVNPPSTTQEPPSTTIDNSSKSLTDKYSILQDFKQRYVNEYNKVNGTDFGIYDIELHLPVQRVLLKTFDNQFVTIGGLPDETKEVLNNYGGYTIVSPLIEGTMDLIQITTKKDHKAVESATYFTDENGDSFLAPVLSGNDLDSLPSHLKNKDGLSKTNTLVKYYELAHITMNLYNSYDQNSINYHTDKYNAAIRELENITNKDLEKD